MFYEVSVPIFFQNTFSYNTHHTIIQQYYRQSFFNDFFCLMILVNVSCIWQLNLYIKNNFYFNMTFFGIFKRVNETCHVRQTNFIHSNVRVFGSFVS